MTMQTILPFEKWDVPGEHAELLRLANSAAIEDGWAPFDGYCPFREIWKRWHFYPFKARFLETHAVPDGWDLQILTLECRACGGTGRWHSLYSHHVHMCNRCSGGGVYRVDAVKLSRWRLGALVFHCPEQRWRDVESKNLEALATDSANVIKGLVAHDPVAAKAGITAFFRLLWFYERDRFYELAEVRVNEAFQKLGKRMGAPFNAFWKRARNWVVWSESRFATDLREWLSIPADDVPF